ncbi:MAG: precorrin-6A reductase [Bacillota bacterium]
MILLLGGTRESRDIARELQKGNQRFVISTASAYGGQIASQDFDNVLSKTLNYQELVDFCKAYKIDVIIDATHPFAINISTNAMAVCKKLKINYLRFERQSNPITPQEPYIKIVHSIEEAVQLADKIGNRILLTIGTRLLKHFGSLIATKEIFARVLPDISSLETCFSIGLLPKNIIAAQGPFSVEFNKILITEKKIDVVVTKNSGEIGGLESKICACSSLHRTLIIIEKPRIEYPCQITDLNDLHIYLQEVKE